MAKTITAAVTLHVKDVKRSRPFRYDALGALISGRHVVIEVPPGTPVRFEDEDEADRIIAHHGGEVVDSKPAHVVPPKEDDVDDGDDGESDDAAKKTGVKKSAAPAT